MKSLILEKLEEFGSITYVNANDIATIDNILSKHSITKLEDFNHYCESGFLEMDQKMYLYTFMIIGIIFIFLILWWLNRKQVHLHNQLFITSVLLAIVILIAGLTSPMIEIDARIKEMTFILIGEQISFNDQVIFFESKSIVNVVQVLIETGKWDSIAVGILILAFSILFPFAKLISSKLYLISPTWRKNKFIEFFALKSGKWSMADVYVVAIFMAYIGFKGILDSQLDHLNMKTDSLASISTNDTTLQPGFILFVAFVLFSMVLSPILQNIKTRIAPILN